MTFTQLAVLAGAALTLAACSDTGNGFPPVDSAATIPHAAAPVAPTPAQAQKVATCAGETILAYIGHSPSELPTSGTWSTLRVIHPGDKVTSDFLGSRLNVVVNGQGVITDLYCG